MKKLIAMASAVALSVGLSALPAQAGTVASSPTAAPTAKSDYTKKQKNRFWRVVKSYEPDVIYAGKRDTINLGISTCEYLRAGGDMYGLAFMVLEADAGVAEDAVIAVIAAAPVVLCPDQGYKFE
jgi:hypothetical protein